MAGSTRQSREHKKLLAARRAQFRLYQTFEYIDFVEDILGPESEALLSGKVRLDIDIDSLNAAQSIIPLKSIEPGKVTPDETDSSGTS